MHPHWAHVGRGAAALGAAMGIGRFGHTPILPLMTTQAALAGTASTRLTRSMLTWRTPLVVLVATLAAMPFASNAVEWVALRTVARLHQRGRVRHRRHLDARPPRRSFTAHVGMGFRRSRHRHRSLRDAASRIG